MSGLKPGQKYLYRVCAENAAGVSDPAEQLGPLLADDPHGAYNKHKLNQKHFFFINPSSSLDGSVLSQPNLSLFAVGPTFDLSGFRKGLEVIVPQPLTVRVPITGYPTPVAKWTFGEKELTPADERVSMVTKPTYTELTISPSVRPDKGIYTLQLENDVSSVSGDIDVNVIGKNP